MEDNGLDCLDLLEATPAILRGLMCELSDEDARWKPAPDRFSVAEVLAHLSHSEGHCYRMRVDRFLARGAARVRDRRCAAAPGAVTATPTPKRTSTTSRNSARPTWSTSAASPPAPAAASPCTNAAGQITLAEMLHAWALHDLGHIRQVAELARARKYLPGAGPLGKEYVVRP